MPQIVCPYCLYIGQGETKEDQWKDVEKHEHGAGGFIFIS
jgi:hypothetical protein